MTVMITEKRFSERRWYRAQSTWNLRKWIRIVFGNGSRFERNPDHQKSRVWKHQGQWCNTYLSVVFHTA
ncbi:hypothetical protein TNCV_2187941 [Trichonephila clavipes]|nr:hypothetical protein TNCV_2187941 [Trichonephila clavipes]